MSKTGKVTSWRGPFGFVETADGESVYIHTSEIDGGRLRVGLEVKFDVEDGKDGKPRGTNVSGDAVAAKGTKLTEEELEEDKKRKNELRDQALEKNREEFDPVWEKVSAMTRANRMMMLTKLLETEKIGEIVERRADPSNKDKSTKFTQGEFLAFYGKTQGAKMWKEAGSRGGKKSAPKKITRE